MRQREEKPQEAATPAAEPRSGGGSSSAIGRQAISQEHPLLSQAFSVGEEIAHAVTHGLGVVLSISALIVLVAFAALRGTAWHVVTCAVFGVTLVLLYTVSTLYHSLTTPRAKAILRRIDHCAIFLLIAGTYTPFMLVNLRGGWGWSLFGVVWGLALLGVAFKLTAFGRFRVLSVVFYLLMGWLVAIAVEPLIGSVAPGGIALLFAGGLCYTVGIIFFAWTRLPYNHAIWHLFVLAGSTLHFFAVLFHVIPPAARAAG